MDSQKILIDIASVSERVVRTLVRYAGRKTVESFRLDKIVVRSGAVLETLNKTLLLNDGSIDDRLADWLGGGEPQACLNTLNQMERILNRKPTHGGRNFFNTSNFTHTQDISNEAIRLFQIHKYFFHFLLMPTDIWNRENDTHQSQVAAQYNVPCRVAKATDRRDLAQISERKIGDTSSVPQGENVKKQAVDAEKLKNILGWLDAWNSKEIHRRTTHLHQSGTCAWLPNTNAFKTWRSMQDSFLWLHGKAGAGKSVLAASVIENLKDTLKDGEILVFFYCDFRSERSTSAAEVMRSLLSQLLQQFSWSTVDHGDLIDELVKGRDEGTSAINDVMVLAHYVSRVAEQFNQQPLIVIDALDGCKDLEDFLDALEELTKGGLRLLVTSRPLQAIKDSLSNLPSISMEIMKYEVSADIKLHVARVLDSHRRLRIVDTSLKKEIYSALCHKADGMFRWVQCQLDIVKRCMTAVRVREALNNLPSDLDATYERILVKINEDEEGEVVRRALEWLVAALAPLQLSQIMESLSIDLGRRVLDHESGPVHGHALLDALGSLVTYDELTDVVILSHFSVKEYLMGQSTRAKHLTYCINEQAAHTQLALLCMCYIVAYFKRSQHPGGYQALPRDINRTQIYCDDYNTATSHAIGHPGVSFQASVSHPLLEYVLDHGFHHLAHVNPRNRTILRAIMDLRMHVEQHPSEWEWLCEKTDSSGIPWPTLKHDFVLYILIAFAPEPMLRFYLDRATLKLKDGTNPLIYAAQYSKIEHCRTLLSRGVSLDRSGYSTRYYPRQLLPLEVAVWHPDRAVVDLFLRAGSPIPRKLFVGSLGEQMSEFPACNVARLLQTDEFVEWAIDIRDKEILLRALNPMHYYASPEYQLSEKDIDIIQRRLVQIDCDPSTQFNRTSLRIAVSAGHISIVKHMLLMNVRLPHDILLDASRSDNSDSAAMIKFLLNMGSDVHVTSPGGDTSLHNVPRSGFPEDDRLELVQVLVDAGCNPSTYNLAGQTPLHLATMHGYVSIIKYLLSLPVELPPDILLAAPRSNPASTIRFLTSKGADVHAFAANGDTPLHLVLDSSHRNPDECLEGAKILMNAGCNPRVSNAFGETPFDIATKNASHAVVQYFISLNILPPPGILLSVCGGQACKLSPMIDFLISKGADIHLTCPNGDTPLHLAMDADSEIECLRRVEVLANAGCDTRACNLAGETPFHVAARRGHILVMEYLLSIGISAPLDAIFTLLCYSVARRFYYPAVRFLLDKGVDVHIVSEDGMTLLHFAATIHWEDDALTVVKLLVHAGCDPFVSNAAQESPLHIAAQHGHLSVIDYLLSLDMAFPRDVLLAALNGYVQRTPVIRYLVDRGADASVATTDGDTPLHLLLASRNRWHDQMDCLESVKILIDAGCDPRARNSAGETPLDTAARRDLVIILKYLSSQGVPLPHDILRISAPATIHFLLRKGVDGCSLSINDDKELMHRALRSKSPHVNDPYCLSCTQMLVDLGWDPSLRNSSGETPMHVATRHGQFTVVKYLLSQSVPLPADVLLVAVTPEYPWRTYLAVQMTRFFICEGASVNVTAPNGDTPLHLSLRCNYTPDMDRHAQKESWKVVEILLNHGSDPAARNVDGQTPFDLAEAQGHFFKENFLRLVRNSRAQLSRTPA